eukprot:TRINITY_DN5588_c0_g1_i3.p1 TRINITY_DN5588_c0_g1~~TRINITY_DN5588_c0_g1_i3.p1  ORF type:complete len:353 (+),score=76.52 TRINITY_DN5588_c0_g1_i3:94-1152(+)
MGRSDDAFFKKNNGSFLLKADSLQGDAAAKVRKRRRSTTAGSVNLKQHAVAAAAAAAAAHEAAAEKAAAVAAALNGGSGDCAAGRTARKRSSFGSGRGDAFFGPKTPRGDVSQASSARASVGTSGGQHVGPTSCSMTKFLAQQEVISPRHPAVEVPALINELLERGALSTDPRPPPWPQEQPGLSDLEAVQGWLASGLPAAEVRSVWRVECTTATSKAYAGVSRTLGPERLLWHGTAWDAVRNIAQTGFNRAYAGRHGSKLGRGSYFAEDPCYALRFCGRVHTKAVFLAGVLPGSFCRGEEGLVEPPQMDPVSGERYDSTVDDADRPRVFCVFRDFQALPLYLAEVATASSS